MIIPVNMRGVSDERNACKDRRDGDLGRLLRVVRDTRQPERNRVIVLLSFKAGLRACEIAGLEWNMVIDAKGCVGRFIEVPAAIAKNGSGRRIPMSDELRRGLIQLRNVELTVGAVVQSERGGAMRPAAIVNWFAGAYEELGLIGCSSHSGRRTFVTNAARLVMKAGGSLRDVQLLAGHRSIKTTEGYIEGSERAQRRLVKMMTTKQTIRKKQNLTVTSKWMTPRICLTLITRTGGCVRSND